MTKDEFIDAYMARSGLPLTARTPDGFVIAGRERIAAPCDCGEEGCEGWQMTRREWLNDEAAMRGLPLPFPDYTVGT